MTATARLVGESRAALERAVDAAVREFPTTPDPDREAGFGAVAGVLDELARVVALVPPAMTRATGGGDGDVERLAGELVTALVAHRNRHRGNHAPTGPLPTRPPTS